MKIELEMLDSEKSQEFLAYFIAQLKQKNNSPFLGNGTANFNENGQFVTLIEDFIPTNDGEGTAISWKITQNGDGTIPFIEVVSNSTILISNCSEYIHSFTNKVLKLALLKVKEKFFNRSYFCFIHGSNLNGEYWINKNTRIAPLYPNDDSHLMNAERIIVIDQIVEAIDRSHSLQLGEEKSLLLSSQLAFLLNIGLYKPVQEERWVIYKEGDDCPGIKNKRLALGVWDENGQSSMPNKGELCPLSRPLDSVYKYERYIGEQLSIPQETRKILAAVDKANYKNKISFDKCCRLYNVALNAGMYHPTIRLSYLYGAIDSIAQTTKSYSGFSEFMRKYSPESTEEFLEFMHSKVRSAHWHSGEFVMGENESSWKEHLTSPNDHMRFTVLWDGTKQIRNAILNWVFDEIIREGNNHITR